MERLRLREERVCWGNGGRVPTLSPCGREPRGKRAVLTKKKEFIWTPRRDPWSTHRRETRLVVKFRNERNDKESQKSDVLVSRLTRQYNTL